MDCADRLGEPIALAQRLLPMAAALIGVLAGGLVIGVAGKRLADDYAANISASDIALDAETEELALQAAEPDRSADAASEGQAQLATTEDTANTGNYERVAPRAPLGKLGAAQAPKPKKPIPPEDWRPTRLFNPVATAAGIVEAQGYRVALAGVEPTPIDQDCTYEGREWPCGARARTAFRAWLRARAVQCVVPPTPDRELITAECAIGKDDLSAWLVASGWARPSGQSSFAEAAEQAKAAKLGIYGPPQNRVNLTIDPGRPAPLNAPMVDAPVPDQPAEAPIGAGPFPPPPPPGPPAQ